MSLPLELTPFNKPAGENPLTAAAVLNAFASIALATARTRSLRITPSARASPLSSNSFVTTARTPKVEKVNRPDVKHRAGDGISRPLAPPFREVPETVATALTPAGSLLTPGRRKKTLASDTLEKNSLPSPRPRPVDRPRRHRLPQPEPPCGRQCGLPSRRRPSGFQRRGLPARGCRRPMPAQFRSSQNSTAVSGRGGHYRYLSSLTRSVLLMSERLERQRR